MKKIAFITSRFPFPLNKGDKLRAYNQIKSLSQYAEVHLISISEKRLSISDRNELDIYCKSVTNFYLPKSKRRISLVNSIFNSLPFSVGYFYNKSIKKRIKEVITKLNPDTIHSHLIRTAEYVPSLFIGNKTIDYMDCFSIGAKKELESTKNIAKKIFLFFEYKKLKKYEEKVYSKFNSHFVISKIDNENMPFNNPAIVVPNGVDFKIFKPKKSKKFYDIMFSGHMGYIPNIVAAKYVINEIHPLIKDKKLLIAGVRATQDIYSLMSENVDVIENFSHIKEAFYQSKILVAPMQISIGLQNKILQAMAMKIPVVCSTSANKAIMAKEGKNILIAYTPENYVTHIESLLSNSELYNSITKNAFEFVKSNFDWEIINKKLSEIILNEQ